MDVRFILRDKSCPIDSVQACEESTAKTFKVLTRVLNEKTIPSNIKYTSSTTSIYEEENLFKGSKGKKAEELFKCVAFFLSVGLPSLGTVAVGLLFVVYTICCALFAC